ncbi:hypothetical protein L484_020445 [Morus notabilis]|uniref:Uncharacterized protein n=1 Tax=Morus notabilis TaxID=981085 RepID=W9SBI1_9ROSA|nr:hypothetical protein L484_020445 [Morus notabilis]
MPIYSQSLIRTNGDHAPSRTPIDGDLELLRIDLHLSKAMRATPAPSNPTSLSKGGESSASPLARAHRQ